MCTNVASIQYKIDTKNYVPSDEMDESNEPPDEIDASPRPIPPESTTLIITVPVRVTYYLEGETAREKEYKNQTDSTENN